MDEALKLDAPEGSRRWTRVRRRARACAPTRVEMGLALSAGALSILSFPDFNLWPLAWVGLVPLFVAIARRPQRGRAFLLGWLTGTLFFYGTCYWLSYAMIHYGHIPAWAAYLLVLIPCVAVGLFPALCCMVLARAIRRWGVRALFLAPVLWATFEWVRLGVTGQLWNAIGYSQAYAPQLIQTARWGGVYLVSFLILMVNGAVAYALMRKDVRALKAAGLAVLAAAVVAMAAAFSARGDSPAASSEKPAAAVVVAVQPDVPMDEVRDISEETLRERHSSLSEQGLQASKESADVPRVIIWPESPMYFAYARDASFRRYIADFAAKNHASVLFNSQEPAPANGVYNSAVMVNDEGRLIAQYDKIRLLPFGEYVPLPRWIPGVSAIPAMVGDFTPGAQYTLMPLGAARAGVFICFESAFPSIARHFADDGADVLVNISNDGYLGPTPVMRQHLANTIFRAVENDRPVLRVTNTGITAFITAHGEVLGATNGFQPEVRTWTVDRAVNGKTFYTRFGDLFVWLCAVMSLVIVAVSWRRPKQA